MEFLIAFINFGLAMWLAWRGGPRPAVLVFFVGVAYTLALYLRHATDALPLSF